MKGPMLEKFKSVTTERLTRLEAWLHEAEEQRLTEQESANAKRELHTLKGDMRVFGRNLCAAVAHVLEDLWHQTDAVGYSAQETNDAIAEGIALLHEMVGLAPDEGKLSAQAGDFVREHEPAPVVSPQAQTGPPTAPPRRRRSHGSSPAARRSGAPSVTRSIAAPPPANLPAGATTETLARNEGLAATSMRIDMADLEDLDGIFSDLRMQYHQLRATMRTVAALGARFSQELPGDVGLELRRELIRASTGGDAGARDLFSTIERFEQVMDHVRLLPLRVVGLQAKRGVRELTRRLDRKVRLDFDDDGIRADAQVVECLADALVHLLRNAVDHGIESPPARRAAGKDETGTVAVRARLHGERLRVTVTDDGRGIDLAAIGRAAVERRMLSPEAARGATEEELLDVLFAPGFSTREVVTDTSGRGIGLDAVRARLEAIGGRVWFVPGAGAGTRVVIDLPTRASLTRALIVSSLDGTMTGIPTNAVLSIRPSDPTQIVDVGKQRMMRLATAGEDEPVSGRLAPLLPMHPADAELADEEGMVVVLDIGGRPTALRVAHVLGPRVVLQKPLGAFMAESHVAVAAALLEDGRVASVVDVRRLVERARTEARRGAARRATKGRAARILVVDDSELTRDMVAGMLRDEGYEVLEAVNGKVALQLAAQHTVDLILTDLQMPVLDGFELTRHIRASPKLADLPICVFSTLSSKTDRDLAAKCGADVYLVKTEMHHSELLGTVRRFVDAEQGAA